MSAKPGLYTPLFAMLAAAVLSTTALSSVAIAQVNNQSVGATTAPAPTLSDDVGSERWQLLMDRFATDAARQDAASAAAAAALEPSAQDGDAARTFDPIDVGVTEAALADETMQLRFKRHLPVPAGRLSLAGERAALRIPVHVPRTEATRTTHLRVGALTSVAALPDVSSLEVYLNGTLMGTMAPRYDTPREASFPIEPGQLVEGVNEVMFLARQQHRIECTIEGTYELWTRIIPELTAFVGDGPANDAHSLSSLQSVLGQSSAPTTLKVDLSSARTPKAASDLFRLVNALILHGHISEPRIVPASSDVPGTTIAIGRSVNAALQAPGAMRFDGLSNLVMVPGDADGATLLLGGSPAEIDRMLARIEDAVPERPTVGSERGLETFNATFLREVDEATSVSFAELGVESHEFTGRNFEVELGLRLPGDFYEADYGSVLLYLDGAYSGGYLDNTQLSVEVNGAEAVTLDLPEQRRTRLNRKELRIPLTFFHGGHNTVTLNAELLTERDLACAPEHAPVSEARFAIADTSRIVVPGMARVGVAPNLAATLSKGFPYTLDDEPTPVHLVGDRTTALSTALSLFGTITANARTVEQYDVSFAPPDRSAEGFVIGNANAMPRWASELIGPREGEVPVPAQPEDDGTLMGGAVGEEDRAELAPRTIAAGLPNFLGGGDFDAVPSRLLDTLDNLDTLDTEGLRDFLARHVNEPVADTYATLLGGAQTTSEERVFKPGGVVLAQQAVSDATGLDAVLAAVLRGEPPRTVTVVATDGPGGLADRIAREDRASPRFDASGQYYSIDSEATRTIIAGGDGILYATQTPGLMNLRYVAAGWLATNYRFYVALMTVALLVLGFLTWRATRSWQSAHTSGGRDA